MKIDEGRCVYALYNPITDLTKVGVTDNVAKRQYALELACGCRLKLLYNSKHLLCGDTYEAIAHDILSKYRTLGEWFKLPSTDMAINAIKEATKNATDDYIVENYKKGASITKMAEEYNVTRQAILARLKKYGVYDNNGKIYEKHPDAIYQQPPKRNKTNPSEHIADIDESYDDTVYLDGVIPQLPLKNLKRIEPNINSNGEWHQISIFKDGEFIYSYTQDINKARAYIQGVRAINFAENTNNRKL